MGSVFLGTPAAAVPSLAALADVADVDLVVTQPDRHSGRGSSRAAGSVASAARQFGFRVVQPDTAEELFSHLREGAFEIGLIVAYGRILTPSMLAVVERGILNVHFSLLPRWRGAAPVERAIAAGDERTGVTLMKIDEGLDTGPVLGEIATPIGPNETGGSLTARLSYLGASLVDGSLPDYMSGRRRPVSQIATGALHAGVLTKAEAQLDPLWSVERAERVVRAFSPRPGAWVETPAGTLRIHAARRGTAVVEPGSIASISSKVVAGFDRGSLELVLVQPESKATLDAGAWMNGRRGEPTTFVSPPQ